MAATLVIKFAGETCGCKFINSNRLTLVVVIAVVLSLGAAVLTGAYVCPRISNADVRPWLPLAAAVVLLLAAVVPLTGLLLKARYGAALVTLLVSIGAAAAAAAIVKAGVGAVMSGGESFGKSTERMMEREKLKEAIR